MATQLPVELETMILDYGASRSVQWFAQTMDVYLETTNCFARCSFTALLRMPVIPIAERVEFYKNTFMEPSEFDAIEERNLRTFLESLVESL